MFSNKTSIHLQYGMKFLLHYHPTVKTVGFLVQKFCKGRKEPNRLQKRNAKNTPYYKDFYLNDKVRIFGRIGHITGFTSGCVYIKNSKNEYITLPNKSYQQVGISNIRLLHHNNNWQYVNKRIA